MLASFVYCMCVAGLMLGRCFVQENIPIADEDAFTTAARFAVALRFHV